ncbi:MAG TPA: Ig-like domain-containing protein, partial [Longilinea sp.]|nr:Ig-like domain-containing protein [Longilinea sp.]
MKMVKKVFPKTSLSQKFQWLLTFVALFSIVITAACGGQNPAQETPAAVGESSFAIEPVEPLPPALVEATPLPDSVLGQQESIDLYFNQPMDQGSVESALRMQPAVQRSLEWVDDSTLRITPQEDLPAESILEISVGVTAQASNGLAFQDPVSLTYHAPSMLIASELIPSPESTEIDPSSAIIVNFNQPVVPLGADNSSVGAAFTVTPEVQGEGEWLNTSTYIFYPDPALQGGVRYTVNLDPNLISTNGMGFADTSGSSWSFTTALPMLVNLTPIFDSNWIWLDQEFVMSFNQPMDTDSFESGFSLVGEDNTQVAGSFLWNESNSEVTFTPATLLARSTTYTLTILDSVQGAGGSAIDHQTIAQYETVPTIGLLSTNPSQGSPLDLYMGTGYYSITFTTPLAQQDFEELVTISPGISSFSVSASTRDTTIYIYASFAPSSTYTITVDGALRDLWGDTLGEPLILTVQTAASQPGLSVFAADSGMGAMVLLPGEVTTPARAINISSIDLTSAPISVSEFIGLSAYDIDRQSYSPGAATTWHMPLSLGQNIDTPVNVPLTNQGQDLPTGLYFYRIYSADAAAGQDYYSPTVFLAEVSQVHLVVKTSTRQVMIWAVDSITLEPVGSTNFVVLDDNGNTVASGQTDAQGVGMVDLVDRVDPWSQVFVQIGLPGDANFCFASSAWNAGVTPWDYGLNFNYESTAPFIYMYSDRAIYQPGQTMYYRGIIRQPNNGRYSNAGISSIGLEIYGISSDPSIGYAENESFTSEVSSWGTFSGEYVIPEDALPGSYYIQTSGDLAGYLTFTVAEYRKPEIDLSVDFSETGYVRGNDLDAQVNAQYYFGAPAGNQAFTWTLYASQGYFSIPGGYQTGTFGSNWWGYESDSYYSDLGQFIISGEGRTDADGVARVNIPSSDILAVLATENLYNMTLEVTIQDATGMPTSARGETTLHMTDFYIGVRPDQWGGSAGEEMAFSVFTTGWDAQSSGSHSLTATFSRVEWEENGIDPYTMAPIYEPVYTTIGSTDFVTDADGHARLSFTPDQPGTYMLSVSGEGALTEVLTWVGGSGMAVWPNLPDQQLELTADAGQYTPGDTASIFIPNPLGAGATGLVTVELGEVMRYETIQFDGSSYTLSLELGAEDAPNIYVSVFVLGPGSNGETTFRMGYV